LADSDDSRGDKLDGLVMTRNGNSGECMVNRVVMLIACTLVTPLASADDVIEIDDLHWLAGVWIGEGQEGDDGDIEGVARQYWTPPLEGSISLFFTWHSADTQHVHYAVNIFQQTKAGIVGQGIHYGPNFENFEDHPWSLKATRADSNTVVFRCVEHCRSESVSFTLLDDGVLEERWALNPQENKPDWIVRYRRENQVR
jgi:hypothetical protein